MQGCRSLPRIVVGLVVAAGCSDYPTQSPDVARNQAVVDDNRIRDLSPISRFDVRLEASGALRPGIPILVSYSVTANVNTTQAAITLRTPEIEIARVKGWIDAIPQPNQRVPAVREINQPLASGQRVDGQISLVIPVAGYYRVALVADAVGSSIFDPTGQFVTTTSVDELWLLVKETGGRSTQDFDVSVFSPSQVRQPGPFLRQRLSPVTDTRYPVASNNRFTPSVRSTSSDFNEVAGYLLYYHTQTGEYRGVSEAEYRVRVFDIPAQQYVWDFVNATGPDGYWQDTCPYSQYRHDIEFNLTSTKIAMELPYVGVISTSEWDCGRTDVNHTAWYSNPSHVFVTMTRARDGSFSFFQRARGLIRVRIGSDSNSYYQKEQPWGPGGHADRITMSSFSIWGPWGAFVHGHEYGHAIHHRALGDYPGLDSGCEDHTFSSTESMLCAMVEGFADYHAIAVFGAETEREIWFEANAYHPGGDGSRIEAPIASFLYDITDAANEGHDSLGLSGQYVGDVMSSCMVWIGNWESQRAIDHLVYCMENQVDPWIAQSGYFPASDRPSLQSENASEPGGWSPGAIRALWLHNLYGQ